MERYKLRMQAKESGFSLVEILISIVLLSLLIMTFLLMFLQSAKTNKASEDIVNATYVAQTEMEKIYAVSKTTKFEDRKSEMLKIGYETVDLEKFTTKNSPYIEVKLTKRNVANNLINVIVDVYNNKNDKKLKAHMETILSWGGG